MGVSENMVPPNHPFVHRVGTMKFSPSILGGFTSPHFWFNIHIQHFIGPPSQVGRRSFVGDTGGATGTCALICQRKTMGDLCLVEGGAPCME